MSYCSAVKVLATWKYRRSTNESDHMKGIDISRLELF